MLHSDGKNGMGQAQSQSMGGDCSDCYGSGEGIISNIRVWRHDLTFFN